MRAAVKNQAELIAVSHAEPVDLTYKSDEEIEKAYLQYVSGWMFSTLGVRQHWGEYFRRTMISGLADILRSNLTQLLDAPFWPGCQSNRPYISHGE